MGDTKDISELIFNYVDFPEFRDFPSYRDEFCLDNLNLNGTLNNGKINPCEGIIRKVHYGLISSGSGEPDFMGLSLPIELKQPLNLSAQLNLTRIAFDDNFGPDRSSKKLLFMEYNIDNINHIEGKKADFYMVDGRLFVMRPLK